MIHTRLIFDTFTRSVQHTFLMSVKLLRVIHAPLSEIGGNDVIFMHVRFYMLLFLLLRLFLSVACNAFNGSFSLSLSLSLSRRTRTHKQTAC